MILNKAIANERIPSLIELEHAVKRNFGGLEDFDTWSYFHEELKHLPPEVQFIECYSILGFAKYCFALFVYGDTPPLYICSDITLSYIFLVTAQSSECLNVIHCKSCPTLHDCLTPSTMAIAHQIFHIVYS